MEQPTPRNFGAADVVFSTTAPFSVDVMDHDFRYSANCTKALREYARSIGHELSDIVINHVLETELDHSEATKAKEESTFEIHRVQNRLIGVYQTKTTIRSNQP